MSFRQHCQHLAKQAQRFLGADMLYIAALTPWPSPVQAQQKRGSNGLPEPARREGPLTVAAEIVREDGVLVSANLTREPQGCKCAAPAPASCAAPLSSGRQLLCKGCLLQLAFARYSNQSYSLLIQELVCQFQYGSAFVCHISTVGLCWNTGLQPGRVTTGLQQRAWGRSSHFQPPLVCKGHQPQRRIISLQLPATKHFRPPIPWAYQLPSGCIMLPGQVSMDGVGLAATWAVVLLETKFP